MGQTFVDLFNAKTDRVLPLPEYRDLVDSLYGADKEHPDYLTELAEIAEAHSKGALFVIIRLRGEEVHRCYVTSFTAVSTEKGTLQ